jgi:DNA-binding response OmpR family regulator
MPAFADDAPILVVEDEEAVAGPVMALLRRLGRPVLRASAAEQALELLRQARPALLVLDTRLAGGAGAELLLRLHREHPSPGTRVLALADGDEGDGEERLREAGADDSARPVPTEALFQRAAALLGEAGEES